MHTGPCGGQKKALGPLKLESQVVESHQTWVLGTYLKSSGRAVHALNYGAISSAPSSLHQRKDFYSEHMLVLVKVGSQRHW